jgi:hypothetical protein
MNAQGQGVVVTTANVGALPLSVVTLPCSGQSSAVRVE